ncbi:MAG: hypothetical protein KDA25_11505, partial [Phycisphaerales bacterium]|nr:hypothetical protein [Phycisphaerales bacterium]
AMWFGRPGADIESEYRAIAASLPDDPGAQYLHARSRPWDADTESMFVALSANPRYATRALAARHRAYLSSGRFEEALAAARSMRRLDPSDDALIGPEIDALHALGRLDEAIGLALQWWQLESTNGGRAIVLMSLRHEAGRAAEAADVVREFTWAESARVDVVVRRWEPRLRSALAYLTADVEGYEFALARREDASGRLEAALSRGDDDDALAQLLMAPAGLRSLEDCLSVAVGAAHRGHHATHAAFDAAMDVLARTRQSGHALVERLRAGERLRIDDVLAASLNPRETALLLLALAQRERIDRAAAHDLARRIMFDRTPPYRIVRMVLTRT